MGFRPGNWIGKGTHGASYSRIFLNINYLLQQDPISETLKKVFKAVTSLHEEFLQCRLFVYFRRKPS